MPLLRTNAATVASYSFCDMIRALRQWPLVLGGSSSGGKKGRHHVVQAAVTAIRQLLDPPQRHRVAVVRPRQSQQILLGGRERGATEVLRYRGGWFVIHAHGRRRNSQRFVFRVMSCSHWLVGMVGYGSGCVCVVSWFMGGQHPRVPSSEPCTHQGAGQAEEQPREERFGTRSRTVCRSLCRLARLLLRARQCRHGILLHSRYPPRGFLFADAGLRGDQGGEAVTLLVSQAAIDHAPPG